MCPRIGLDLPTLVHAATEIADTHGFDEVTLASLAKKLNIRTPSLYNHIDGLHGLRKKLAIHGIEMLRNALTQAAIGRSGDDAVHAMGAAYICFARLHPGLYEATLRAPDPNDSEVVEAGRMLVELAVQVLSHYGLKDDAALHAVRGLRSIFHGFASLEQKGGFGLSLDLDKSFRLLVDSFLAGIHKMTQGK